MKCLIDGDIVTYRAACSAIGEEQWVALARADKTIQDILEETKSDSYIVYLTGSNNFRREIAPSYKAHRPEERPEHWQAVREFLVTHHNGHIVDGYEADDALGIAQTTSGNTVICSIDKDLLQVPGIHYNFVKKEWKTVTHEEGIRALYTQSLVGDRSDNIEGIRGIGPVKAKQALCSCETEEELYDKCRSMYGDDERFHLNMKLLYIWRKPADNWEPPAKRVASPGSGHPAQARDGGSSSNQEQQSATTQETQQSNLQERV